ncbi:MAG: hypothetical protein ACLFQK_04080 [Fibrobacterota bacterium]
MGKNKIKLGEYSEWLLSRGVKGEVLRSYMRETALFLEYRERAYDRISAEDIYQYLKDLGRKSYSVSTLKYKRFCLACFFCTFTGICRRPPKIKGSSFNCGHLSLNQTAALIREARGWHAKVFFQLLAGSGLRPSELIRMRHRAFCAAGKDRIILLSDSGGCRRQILFPEILHRLREKVINAGRPDSYLFSLNSKAAPSLRRFQVEFKKAAIRSGLKIKGGTVLLRNTFISVLADAGIEKSRILRVLGVKKSLFLEQYLLEKQIKKEPEKADFPDISLIEEDVLNELVL